MDFIVEFLLEIVLEVVAEVLFRLTGRSLVAVSRPVLGLDEPSSGWKVVSWSLVVTLSAALGWFRGLEAGDHPRWGLWLAIAVVGAGLVRLATACREGAIDATRREKPVSVAVPAAIAAEPLARARPRGLRATFTWWPPERVAWFVTANATFASTYLAAMVLSGANQIR